MTSMIIVYGRLIGGNAGSSSEGRDEEMLTAFMEKLRSASDRENQSLKDKVKALTTRVQKLESGGGKSEGGKVTGEYGSRKDGDEADQMLQVQQDGSLPD